MKHPNILLIMTDQQRWDSLGCYGADWIETPNLDRLATEGTRFTRCTVNNTICTPSRASIFTGKELPGHGVYRLHDVLPDSEVLFTERLRAMAGYRTALFGKLHVSGRGEEEKRRHPNDGFETYEWCLESCVAMDSRFNGYVDWLRGRDPAFLDDLRARKREVEHHPEDVHFTHWSAERTSAYIAERSARGEPFFCAMSLFDPHNPYRDYPLTMVDKVDRERIPDPIVKQGLPACVERERQNSYFGTDLDPDTLRDIRFGYGASIAFADQEIGKVLSVLDSCGAADNTLVVFTSDHGDSLGDHGLMVKGVGLYDPVVRVPLIMRWPGRVPAGATCDALVQLHDLARTFLNAAGIEAEREGPFDSGVDLVDVARRGETDRRFAVCAYRNSGIDAANAYWDPPMKATSVCSGRYKLVAYTAGPATEFEFFDLETDPLEQHDRSGDPLCVSAMAEHLQYLGGWLHQEAGLAGSRGGDRFPAADDFMQNAISGSA